MKSNNCLLWYFSLAYSKFNKYCMSLIHTKDLIPVGNSQWWRSHWGMQAYAGEFDWEMSGMETYFFTILVFFVPRFSERWRLGTNITILRFLFSYYRFSFFLSPNPPLNEPLLLVGVCCVPQMCGAEQKLRTLVLCWYFLNQISTPCNLPLVISTGIPVTLIFAEKYKLWWRDCICHQE